MNRSSLLLPLLLVGALAAGIGAAPPWRKPAVARQTPPPLVPVPMPAPAPSPAKDWTVPGLSLDAPQTRTRPGVAYVAANVSAAPTAKVKIIWRVRAAWDDETLETEYEVRDGGKRVQVVIPDCSGTVYVSAVAIVDGEPTSEKMAETTIEVAYVARKTKAAGPIASPRDFSRGGDGRTAGAGDAAPAAPPAAGPVTEIVFVVDVEGGDVNVNALVASVGLLNRLRAAGIKRRVVELGSAKYVSEGLTVAKDWMVLRTASGVKRTAKVPATLDLLMAEVAR